MDKRMEMLKQQIEILYLLLQKTTNYEALIKEFERAGLIDKPAPSPEILQTLDDLGITYPEIVPQWVNELFISLTFITSAPASRAKTKFLLNKMQNANVLGGQTIQVPKDSIQKLPSQE